jgi:hypothetical protein
VLPRQPWFFVDPFVQKMVKVATAERYAQLHGRRLHLRGTSRPWSTKMWREAMMRYPAEGAALAEYEPNLHLTSRRLDRMSLADRVDMLGVQLHNRRHPEAELEELRYTLAGPGFEAEPARPSEIAWLMKRSMALGCPIDAPRALFDEEGNELGWEAGDIQALADGSDRFAEDAFARTTVVRSFVDEEVVEKHVTVSTLGRVAEFNRWEPWLAMLARLPFPVETSVVIDVLTPEKAMSRIQRAKRKVDAQIHHHGQMKAEVPYELDVSKDVVKYIAHDIAKGMEGEATRTRVWVHFATFGDTASEDLQRAAELRRLFSPKVEVEITQDQVALVDSFTPGEKHPTSAFVREMSVRALARAVPTADTGIGHRVGDYIGYTSFGAARQPVLFDPHYNQEVENTGQTILVVGDLGTGKSSFGAMKIFQAVTGGEHCSVFDPGGAMARLCRLWPKESLHIDLMSASEGLLGPFGIIPDPIRANYDTDKEYVQAQKNVASLRHSTAMTMFRMMLPAEIQSDATFFALDEAVTAVGGHISASGDNVISALAGQQGPRRQLCQDLARILKRIGDSPAGRLLFAQSPRERLDEIGDPLLTVITAAGIALPDERKSRLEWTLAESLNATLVHHAAMLVHQSVHQRPRDERKTTMSDENYVIVGNSAGQGMIRDGAHMTRQLNQTAYWMSHGAGEFGDDAAELVNTGFSGKVTNRKRQEEVLKAFKLPTAVGYEEMLGSLRSNEEEPREMLAYIGGRHQRITVDLKHLPDEVQQIMKTTPGKRNRLRAPNHYELAS